MYESTISVSDFVNRVLNEVNAVPTFPIETVVGIASDIQTSLFLQVIRLCRRVTVSPKSEGNLLYVSPDEFESFIDEAIPLAEDVLLVTAGDKSLHMANIDQFYNLSIPLWCRMNERIYLKNTGAVGVTVHYVTRPKPIMYNEVTGYTGKICMPQGYLTLLEAGVLAELYRHMGDAENCRRFSEKYNAMLQEMKEHYRWMRGGDAV